MFMMQKTMHGMQHAILKSKPLQITCPMNSYGRERTKALFIVMDKRIVE